VSPVLVVVVVIVVAYIMLMMLPQPAKRKMGGKPGGKGALVSCSPPKTKVKRGAGSAACDLRVYNGL